MVSRGDAGNINIWRPRSPFFFCLGIIISNMNIQPIQCSSFTLRLPKKSDRESLSKHINNKKIYDVTSAIPYPYAPKDFDSWFEHIREDLISGYPKSAHFMIVVDKKAVGGISLDKIQKYHKAEIGYWLSEEYWGQGIMTEAVKEVVKFGFDRLKLIRIYSYIYEGNSGSKKVVEKAGFKQEGIMRNNTIKDGKVLDNYLHSIVVQ